MTRMTAVARFAIIVCAVLFTTVVSAQQITLKPGAIPNKEFHRANARDFAYCEIAPVLGKPPNVWLRSTTAAVRATVAQRARWLPLTRRSSRRSLERSLCS